MKTIFQFLTVLTITVSLNASAQITALNKPIFIETASKCIAAFQRDTSASTLVPPMAYCTCVGEYVAVSKDDKKAAADRAGLYCIQAMKSPDTFAKGFAKATVDNCMVDTNAKKYFPNSYPKFCACLGAQYASLVMSNEALKETKSSNFVILNDSKMEAATGQCIEKQ